MNLGIVFNPISGKGRAKQIAADLAPVVEAAGHQVQLREAIELFGSNSEDGFLAEIELLVVVGGDGTLMPLLEALQSTQTPVYMCPAGNESLFAQAFGGSEEPKEVLQDIEHGETSLHWFGYAGDKPFFHMTSIGLDSQIVRDVCLNRSSPVGNVGYVGPALRRAMAYQPPLVSLDVDGEKAIDRRPGSLVIANHHTYAGKIAPVPEARSDERSLLARFFPDMGRWKYVSWGAAFLFHNKVSAAGTELFTGERFAVQVHSDSRYPVQADGEDVGDAPLEVRIADKQIAVRHRAA